MPNLDEHAAHILKSFNAGVDRLTADERLWIETSADKLRLLYSAIGRSAWGTAFLTRRVLVELGWYDVLASIQVRSLKVTCDLSSRRKVRTQEVATPPAKT